MLRRLWSTLGLLVLLAACGGDDGPPEQPFTTQVKVMTRNLYLGGEFSSIVMATKPEELPPLVGAFWKSIEASDIPGRAKALAAEIVEQAPDLVGLQEVELFRTDATSDFSFDNPAINAATVRYDFLRLIQDELAARGAKYVVVSDDVRTDAELPGSVDGGPLFDVRMTDRDVVLALERPGLTATKRDARLFDTRIPLRLGGKAPLPLVRGFQLVDVTLGETKFVFGNSHLEVGGIGASIQEAQADELVKVLNAVSGRLIVVGDFNSPATAGGTDQTRSYGALTRILKDAWSQVAPTDPGTTCCSALTSPTFMGRTRIDLVLYRGNLRADSAAVVGTDAAKRTPTGLWPSDHAGVVSTLSL